MKKTTSNSTVLKEINMNAGQRFTQVILVIVTIIILAAFAYTKANSSDLHFYDMWGQNKQTGLMVAARIWETDKEGSLHGKVYDEMTVQDQCNGTWVGYGVAQVGCGNGYQYVLRVVEK